MLILEPILCNIKYTTAAGACTGLGIAPNKIKEVYGFSKPM
jgi:adenylosuccinate synthase